MDKGGAKVERGYPGPTRGLNFKKCDNILETVQDIDIVAMED